nr:protein TIFY 4B-like isoform X2 [Erigeron canadensis]
MSTTEPQQPPPPPSSSTTTATSAAAALDKPLHQLTEDDISQLTREDCRRFLKLKGMRRPSWNKSQAIQQVIMLKALLEPPHDTDDSGRKSYIASRHQQRTLTAQKGTSADTEISLSAEESPGHRNDTDKNDILGDNDSANADPSPPPIHGIGGGSEATKGQMTIFYSGKVNVYDDIPADKAQALLQLAASPLQFSQEDPFDGNVLQAPSINVSPDFSARLSPVMQTVRMADNHQLHIQESYISREENSAECSASRKASVQRYLEKRKDR